MYVNWKIERYPKTTSGWSSTAVEITNFYDPVIRTALGESKDTFSFKQTNFNNTLDNYWSVGDKVVIYYKINATASSSDVVMAGIVTNIPNEDSTSNNFIRVEGNNYSEALASALVFYDPNGDTELTQYIQEALNSINIYNDKFFIGWKSTNPSVKTTGDAFPSYNEKWYYKSFLKLLDKYSTDNYTADGNYYWYIDINNELVWKPKTATVTKSFNQTTDNYTSLKTKKDIQGVINFVIAKGGNDPAGKPITVKRDNAVSRAKNGFKYKLIISEHNTGTNLLQADGLNNTTYADAGNYPFTTSFGVLVADSDEYVAAIRAEVKTRLKEEADILIAARKDGKFQLELEFTNGKGWTIGDNVSVTVSDVGFSNKPMRVKEVELTNSGERYTLEEDEGTI